MDGLGFQSLIGILAILRRVEQRTPVGSQGIVSIPHRDYYKTFCISTLIFKVTERL